MRPPTAPVTEPLLPGTPEDVQPPAEPVLPVRRTNIKVADDAGTPASPSLVWRPALGSAVIAGLLAAVGTSLGVVPLTLLCMFAAGGLAVTIYQRLSRQRLVTSRMGARLGILAGGWGFGMLALLSVSELFTHAGRAAVQKLMQQQMQTVIAANSDPERLRGLEWLQGCIATDHGVLLLSLFGMLLVGVFFVSASALGGLLGASLFGREDTPRS